MIATLVRYSEDQPRNPDGTFGEGGGSSLTMDDFTGEITGSITAGTVREQVIAKAAAQVADSSGTRANTSKVSTLEARLLADEPDPPVGRALAEVEQLLRYSEDQPRDEAGRFGEGGGGSSEFDDSMDSLVSTYGDIVHDSQLDAGGLVAVHEDGTITVSFEDDDGALQVWGEFNSDTAFDRASEIRDMAQSAAEYDPEDPDSTPPSDSGLVDSRFDNPASILTGYNANNEVVIGWPKTGYPDDSNNLKDWDTVALAPDDAINLAGALEDAGRIAPDFEDSSSDEELGDRRPLQTRRRKRRKPTKVSTLEARLLADEPDPPVGRALAEVEQLLRYSEDQPRDEAGRFGEGGGGTWASSSVAPASESGRRMSERRE